MADDDSIERPCPEGRGMEEVERGDDLGRFRDYLRLIAGREVSAGLRGRVDLSGVVQESLLDAHRAPPRDRTEAQTAAWLKAILLHNLADEARRRGAIKRDGARERSLRGPDGLVLDPVADQSSPSHRAIRDEELMDLARALATLPESQRRAVEMHHLQARPLAEIAEELGTTKAAVAGLLHRGLKALRARLSGEKDG
jgi:RNA polymerase sigma-70 factor (ECF subfamily)